MVSRKLGPLPIWGWAVAIAGGLVTVYLYRRRSAAAQTPPGAAGGATGAAPFAPPAGYTGTATGMLPGPLDMNGQPIGFSIPRHVNHGAGLPGELGSVAALVAALGSLNPPPRRPRRRGHH